MLYLSDHCQVVGGQNAETSVRPGGGVGAWDRQEALIVLRSNSPVSLGFVIAQI